MIESTQKKQLEKPAISGCFYGLFEIFANEDWGRLRMTTVIEILDLIIHGKNETHKSVSGEKYTYSILSKVSNENFLVCQEKTLWCPGPTQ